MKYKTNWIWEGNDKVNECAVKEARRILGNKKKVIINQVINQKIEGHTAHVHANNRCRTSLF